MEQTTKNQRQVAGELLVSGVELMVPARFTWYHEPEDEWTSSDGVTVPGRDEWNAYIGNGPGLRIRIIEVTDDNDVPTGKFTALSYDRGGYFIDMGLEQDNDDVIHYNVADAMNYVMEKLVGAGNYLPVTESYLEQFYKEGNTR